MKIQEMIDYFTGVKSQHEAMVLSGMYNPNAQVMIKTYVFVINKLEEWKVKEADSENCMNIRNEFRKPEFNKAVK